MSVDFFVPLVSKFSFFLLPFLGYSFQIRAVFKIYILRFKFINYFALLGYYQCEMQLRLRG